ncbi:MAG: MnhB domain-containing protein [Thermoleophilaceae bacterium]
MTTVLTRTVARLLMVPTFVVAGAVLVKGYSDVGDGFSAGVVAALGVLMQYVGLGYRDAERLLPMRLAPAWGFAGLGLALSVAFVPAAAGRPLLTHSPGPGAPVTKFGTLELITPVLFDVGIALLVFGAVVGIIRTLAEADDGRAA